MCKGHPWDLMDGGSGEGSAFNRGLPGCCTLEGKVSFLEGLEENMALPDAGGTLAPTVPVALGGGGGGTALLERSKDRSKC